MNTPVVRGTADMGAELSHAEQLEIEAALADSRAESTRRNYAREWKKFQNYCHMHDLKELPAGADVVCKYLLTLEETVDSKTGRPVYAVGTIEGALAAIKFLHRKAEALPHPIDKKTPAPPPIWDHPKVAEMMSAIKRRAASHRQRPVKQAEPLLLDELSNTVSYARSTAHTWRERLRERRDTAVLLIGWAGAMRRSEIMSLQVSDVRLAGNKWIIDLSRSKVDQMGKGMIKALPTGTNLDTCGPCAYIRWVECLNAYDATAISGLGRSGLIRLLGRPTPLTHHVCSSAPRRQSDLPLFRGITRHADIADVAPGGQLVHKIVRNRLSAARPDLDITRYGAHSLRSGFVTEGFEKGNLPRNIMRQTGHRTMSAVLQYGREKDIWDNNAVTDIGM